MSSIEGIMSVKSPYKSSPVKDTSSPAGAAYNHMVSLLALMDEWRTLKLRGTPTMKAIQDLKLHEITEGDLPDELENYSELLKELTKAMEVVLLGMNKIRMQMVALCKLSKSSDPAFNTWDIDKLSTHTNNLYQAYFKETFLKKTVFENICHCKDEDRTQVYVSSWKYEVYIDDLDKDLRAELNILRDSLLSEDIKTVGLSK